MNATLPSSATEGLWLGRLAARDGVVVVAGERLTMSKVPVAVW